MQSSHPAKNKTSTIPSSQGTIPGSRTDNNFGKTFAKTSREEFSRLVYLTSRLTEFFLNKAQIQSPMDRSLGKFGGGLEDEYHTVSHFHGQWTFCKEHPHYISDAWSTTSKTAFTPQEWLRKHIFRTTNTNNGRIVREMIEILARARDSLLIDLLARRGVDANIGAAWQYEKKRSINTIMRCLFIQGLSSHIRKNSRNKMKLLLGRVNSMSIY